MGVQDARWLVVKAALLALVSSACAQAVVLECQMSDGQNHHLVLDVAEETAQLVMADSVVAGTLGTDEHRYQLTFPKSEDRWETRVQIERYSGTLAWEHGEPPFAQSSVNNLFRSGRGKKTDSLPKL